MRRRSDGTEIPAEAWAELFAELAPPPPRSPDICPWEVVRPALPFGPRTVLVMGVYRGGTSFAAELLAQLGVPMGDVFIDRSTNDYETYEDHDFYSAINDLMTRGRQLDFTSNQWRYLEQVIGDRNEAHELWGFKHPSSIFIVDSLLPKLRNPHLIVVVRDALSIWQSSKARASWMTWPYIRDMVARTLDLFEKPRAPTLAISYERGKERPAEVRDAIKEFIGL